MQHLLTHVTSVELAEWEAYERATGPLGNRYITEKLAEILDEVKQANFMYGGVHAGDDNPIPAPKRSIRPDKVYEAAEQQIEDDEETADPDTGSAEELAREFADE